MIQITNLSAFHNQTTAWVNAVRGGLEKAVVKIMKDAQMYATLQSPTYSGDFASNWNVSAVSPDTSFKRGSIRYEDGDAPTLKAWGKGNFNLGTFKLGQPVFLTNNAFHPSPYGDEDEYGQFTQTGVEDDYYAWSIEKGHISFRPVNENKDRVAGKTLTHIKSTYGTISKGMLA